MKPKEKLIANIKAGELFHIIDSYFDPPRIYYMRKMKRKPKLSPITKGLIYPLQCYGFTQNRHNTFHLKKPAHWNVDGRYKGIVKNKNNWKPK